MAIVPTLMNEALSEYAESMFSSETPELTQLLKEAEQAGIPPISIGGVQGAFLQMLIQLTNAQTIVEVGSLAGYSAITMALAMKGGTIHCYEKNPEYCSFIKMQARKFNVHDRIIVHEGDAAKLLEQEIPSKIDIVFIDADKPSYKYYAELLIPSLTSGGLIIGDNALAWGNVADAEPDFEPENVKGIQAFNEFVKRHNSLHNPCIVPLGDGMCIAVKK